MFKSIVQPLTRLWSPLKYSLRNYPFPVPYQKFLMNLPQIECSVLDNGLTVVSEERECYNACVGLYINGGSRYESLFENGIAHFFEHIAFKGTCARTKTLLEKQMSSVGARFKCFTTREMVVYYAECLCEDLPLVVDILSDCVFNNSYSGPEITQQKKVVYLEMLEHDKDHNETLFDYLHSTAFQGTPLAQTVMGPSSNLYNFNACTISRYLQRLFDPTRTVLVAVGGVKHEQMMCLASSYLSKLQPTKCVDTEQYRFTGSEVRYRDDSMPMANVACAVEGPSFCDPDNLAMAVAANVVGGWDRSQPGGVDHSVRVARVASSGDFCESYKAFNINYKDTGLWGVQFMASSLQLEDMLYAVQDQWMRLCTMVTDSEVERAKRELKTQLLSNTESCTGACHEIGRWMLYNGHWPPLYEQMLKIDKIFASDVKDVCNRYIYDKCPAVAAIGQTEGLPEYTRIRAGMYWLRL
ncbi:cytochrome b-c1 complex subunit 1, mitochondrial-like [Ostrinia nubilalis]|uniref:cytochrome b-c1 complex subunit 1, mitochondrial-like n=1 Tax=Ostrinia nubilalis TaxID=29057 RepID=UPI0030826732